MMKNLLALGLLTVWSSPVLAAPYTIDTLNFQVSAPQSAWGSGTAAELSDTISFTQSWNATATVGDLVDPPPVENPLWTAANETYQPLNTAYLEADANYRAEVNKRDKCISDGGGGDIIRGICNGIHGTQIGVLAGLRLVALESRDIAKLARDELPRIIDLPKTGAEVTISTDGEAGVEFAYRVTAGSVSPDLTFGLSAEIPEMVTAGETFRIASDAGLAAGTINSVSPGFEASINQIIDARLDVSGEACAVACAGGSATLIEIDEKLEILSVNQQEARFLQGYIDLLDPTDTAGLTLPTGRLDVALVAQPPAPPPANIPPANVLVNGIAIAPGSNPQITLATAQIQSPDIQTTGELQGDQIVSSGESQIIDLNLDIDGVMSQIAGTPPGGFSVGIGPAAANAAVSLDAFDITAGPTVDVTQDFALDAELWVKLTMDTAVNIKTLIGYNTVGREVVLPLLCFGSNCTIAPPTRDEDYDAIRFEAADNGRRIKVLSKQFCIGQGPLKQCQTVDYARIIEEPVYEISEETSIVARWTDLPQMILSKTTTFVPEFFTEASLAHTLGLQLGVELDLLLAKGAFNFGPAKFDIGPLFEKNFPYKPDFAKFNLFAQRFDLEGFETVSGDAFTIRAQAPPAVPLAPSAVLLLSALAGMGVARGRSRTHH